MKHQISVRYSNRRDRSPGLTLHIHRCIEAALAAARLGLRTIVFTINLDAVGNMPCNLCSNSVISNKSKGAIHSKKVKQNVRNQVP